MVCNPEQIFVIFQFPSSVWQREAETPSHVTLIYLFESQQRRIRQWQRDTGRQDKVRVHGVKAVMATPPTLLTHVTFLNWGTLVKGYLPQVDGELPRAHTRTECAHCFCQSGLPLQGHYANFEVPSQWIGFNRIITDLMIVLKKENCVLK